MYKQITMIQPNNGYTVDGAKSKFSLEGVGEGSTEEMAFELDLQELSKCKRRKVSPSLAENPAGVTGYMTCLEE